MKQKITSQNIVLHYLFTIISFLLKNIWAILFWRYFSPAKRVPRPIIRRVLRFDVFYLFMWEYIKRVLEFIGCIPG